MTRIWNTFYDRVCQLASCAARGPNGPLHGKDPGRTLKDLGEGDQTQFRE
jgi:hypothetical protein